MLTKPSKHFPDLQVLELFDDEPNYNRKYSSLEKIAKWSDPYEDSTVFYVEKTTWASYSRRKHVLFWLLEG